MVSFSGLSDRGKHSTLKEEIVFHLAVPKPSTVSAQCSVSESYYWTPYTCQHTLLHLAVAK